MFKAHPFMRKVLKILAVQPLPTLLEPGSYVRNCCLEPLGLEYVAAALEAAGHKVTICYPVRSVNEFISFFKKSTYDVVCFSVYTYALPLCYSCAKAVKMENPQVFIVFGGHHPSLMPSETLKNKAVDTVVVGEGEQTIVELVNSYGSQNPFSNVDGICYKNNKGKSVLNKERKRINDLDCLPWPVRDKELLLQARNYQVITPPPSEQKGLAQITFSRGCHYNCRYCTSPVFWKRKVKWRSPTDVLNEIEFLIENYQVNLFYFCDLTINSDKQRLMDLCKEFIKRQINVCWWGLFSPDVIDYELLCALKDAGCVKLSIGVEGANQRAFRFLKGSRSIDWNDIADLFVTAWNMGFITRAFFMIGNIGDTVSYYQRMFEFVEQLCVDDMRVCFTVPFPGTRSYWNLKDQALLRSENVRDYTTEVPLIKNEFSNEQLFSWQKQVVEKLYCSTAYKERVLQRCRSQRRFVQSYLEHFSFLLNSRDISTQMRNGLRNLSRIMTNEELCHNLVSNL